MSNKNNCNSRNSDNVNIEKNKNNSGTCIKTHTHTHIRTRTETETETETETQDQNESQIDDSGTKTCCIGADVYTGDISTCLEEMKKENEFDHSQCEYEDIEIDVVNFTNRRSHLKNHTNPNTKKKNSYSFPSSFFDDTDIVDEISSALSSFNSFEELTKEEANSNSNSMTNTNSNQNQVVPLYSKKSSTISQLFKLIQKYYEATQFNISHMANLFDYLRYSRTFDFETLLSELPKLRQHLLMKQLNSAEVTNRALVLAVDNLFNKIVLNSSFSTPITTTKEMSIIDKGFDCFCQERFRGNFEHIGEVGSGAFGSVLKARNILDDRSYAVKKICFTVCGPSERIIELVIREVKALARLDHRNIVRYYNSWIEVDPSPARYLKNKDDDAINDSDLLSVSDYADLEYNSPHDYSRKNESCNIFNREDADCSTSTSTSDSWGSSISSSPSKKKAIIAFDQKNSQDISVSYCNRTGYILFIQMELCNSGTLKQWLDNPDRKINNLQNLKIFRQICLGLDHIHSKKIIHRDIKPSNIFFDGGRVKIGDFGLAKCSEHLMNEDLSNLFSQPQKHSCGIGTQPYISPEQMSQREYSEKTDVYSLGIILFEMYNIFQTNSERAIMIGNLKKRKNYLFRDFKRMFPAIADMIQLMLSPDPKVRPSCRETILLINEMIANAVQNIDFYNASFSKINDLSPNPDDLPNVSDEEEDGDNSINIQQYKKLRKVVSYKEKQIEKLKIQLSNYENLLKQNGINIHYCSC